MNKSIALHPVEAEGPEGQIVHMVRLSIIDHDTNRIDDIVFDAEECQSVAHALISAGAAAECGGVVN